MRVPRSRAELHRALAFARAEAGGAQACIPLRDVTPLLEEVHAEYFQRRFGDVTWQFSVQRSLANINRDARHIRLHFTLNSHDVPDDVFRMTFIHELLHLEIPPGLDDRGFPEQHTPAFRTAEKARNPHRTEGWGWLNDNLPLKHQKFFDCTEVVPRKIRLTPAQRDWVAEATGIHLSRSVRCDDPLLRTQHAALWLIVLLARHHKE